MFRPNSNESIDFNGNVNLSRWRKVEPSNPSIIQKVYQFLTFCRKFRTVVKEHRPPLIIVHDNLALYALFLALKTIKCDSKLWYHSHDIADPGLIRKYSLGWFACRVETKIFHKLDLFTVPSRERLAFFPINLLKRRPSIVPNYPLLNYANDQRSEVPGRIMKILFQGVIAGNRGLEEVIDFLADFNEELLSCHLIIIGPVEPAYRRSLEGLIADKGVTKEVEIKPRVAFQELIKETLGCHVGLATLKPSNINLKSLGTASNKIFQYASCGLPVILMDTPINRNQFNKYPWVFHTDLSKNSISEILKDISENYMNYSEAAQMDFKSNLNFEKVFRSALKKIEC